MDAIELLTEQHRRIEDLFDRMDVTNVEYERAELFQRLARLLAMHGLVEREHLYPVLRDNKVQPQTDQAEEVHDDADRRIAELLDMRVTGKDFDRKLDELWNLVDAHFKKEEAVLFPKLRKFLNADALRSLAEDIEATLEDLPDRDARSLVAPDTVAPLP